MPYGSCERHLTALQKTGKPHGEHWFPWPPLCMLSCTGLEKGEIPWDEAWQDWEGEMGLPPVMRG